MLLGKRTQSEFLLICAVVCLSFINVKCDTDQVETVKCILPLKPDWSFFSPLIFAKNGTLITTDNFSEEQEDITLDSGYEVILSCAPNYFREFPSEKTLAARCKNDKTLFVNQKEKDFISELSCEVRAIEEIITPVTGCPSTARSIEYGYTNPIVEKSYILGEACYDVKKGQLLFVHTKLRSPNMVIEELALKIRNKTYLHQEHPTSFYKIELMKALLLDELNERLKKTFGPNIPNISSRRFLNEDMLTHKQYQPILKLAWNYAITNDEEQLENLDNLQQDIVEFNTKNLEIYCGTHGILSLKNNEGEQVDVYLKNNKFPVPKYLWTVVRSGNQATAFAVFNRAQISDKDKQKDTFCTSKCEEISWIKTLLQNKQYRKVENGLVLCCELSDFRKTIHEMPPINGITDLLK
uniref:Putative deoxyribonuclease i n=1 Tax=Corethrella appendiculata TaxID=1370023 RepID=U5ED71_9DIPT